MGQLTISMAIFNSYVKLPEGSVTSSGANRAQASRRWRWPTEEKKLSYQLEETEQIYN